MGALVGRKESLASLEETYANPTIRKKLRVLSMVFPHWRAIRGDGNCFYRAAWVGLVDAAVDSSQGKLATALVALRSRFQSAEDYLKRPSDDDAGQGLWDQVQQQFTTLLAEAQGTEGVNEDAWTCWYEDKTISDLFVRYLRSLTSRSLAHGEEEYSLYLPDGQSLASRRTLAETMGEEAEQLEMIALLRPLGVSARVYQLSRDEGNFAVYTLPDDQTKGTEVFTLLYRPGHYDILYPLRSE